MTAAERAFRVLLLLYPRRFRLAYADDMTQLFLDQLRDARAGRASRGVARTWIATFADLGRSSLDEHLRGDRGVGHTVGEPPATLARALGLLGIAGGLVYLSAFVVLIPSAVNIGRLVVFNVGAIAIAVGTWRLIGPEHRRWALPIVALVVLANAAFAVGAVYVQQFEHPFAGLRGLVLAWISIGLWFGDGLLGLVAWRLGGPARLAGASLAVGTIGVLGMDRLWEPTELMVRAALAGQAANALGLILLGLVVARRRPRPAVSPVIAAESPLD